jgi:hypothetical protein
VDIRSKERIHELSLAQRLLDDPRVVPVGDLVLDPDHRVHRHLRGDKMHERAQHQAQQQDDALRKYLQDEVAAPTSTADQLTKLADLHDRGAITNQEYEQEKAKVLA